MINKTFRLFISSTFSDFLTERSILNEEVFPIIDDYCQARGYNFQLIDLRWGVNNESALNQNTLEICLDEVKRCRTLSPKPNFLLMAGERYGWIPLPSTISKEDFEELITVALAEEYTILKKWYIFDENEIGGEYYLKTREDIFVDDSTWSAEEEKLHKALISCASKNTRFPSETKKKLTSSATEQEILEGLLSNADMSDNAIAIFRSDYPEKDSDQSKIDELKKRIKEKMSDDGCTDNIFELTWNNEYPVNFKDIIVSSLKANISKEIERLEAESKKKTALNLLLHQYRENGVIVERKKEFSALEEYESGNINIPLYVIGDSGSGKSTLLAEYVTSRSSDVFCLFYGLDENSYMLVDGLNNLVNHVKQKYDISYGLSINTSNITEGLYEIVKSIPEDKKAIIVVDGLDMYHDINDIHESVFPALLPPNVKIIVSIANGEIADRFLRQDSNTLSIENFSKEESNKVFSAFLKERNRQISCLSQSQVIAAAIGNGATPLQLKLMTEICAKWHSSDLDNTLPSSVEEVALQHLTDMYTKFGHNKELVLYSLALIASSPYGITEEELQLLLLKFDRVMSYFISEDRYNHGLNRLPFVIWSRLFYDLKGCLTLTKSNGFIIVKFVHNIFYRVFTKYFPDYCEQAQLMLETYFSNQDSFGESLMPNVRKAIVLPFLLKKQNKIEKLIDLYNNFSFLDSAVKAGQVDRSISNIQYIIKNGSQITNKNYYITLYNCLQNNRDMLNCYCDGFKLCAAEAGLFDNEVPITVAKKNESDSSLFFPYSYNSQVTWYPEGNKYAVFYRSYVYICDSSTNTELCRIFVQKQIDDKMTRIKGVVWLSDDRIAVCAYGDGIYIYDVGDPIPNLLKRYECCITDSSRIKHSRKYSILFIQKDNFIVAINTVTCAQQYTIPLLRKANLGFDVLDEELYLKEKPGKISVFNIQTGELKNYISAKSRLSFYDAWAILIKMYNLSNIQRVNDHIWFERDEASPSLALYDTAARTKKYIHPPFYQDASELVCGRSKLLIVKTNIIVAVDLINGTKLSYYKLENIKSVSWITEDCTLSIITTDGLLSANISDFCPFPPDVDRCLVMSKTIFNTMGFMGKGLVGGVLKLKPLLKFFLNNNNIFAYDILFSDIMESSDVSLYTGKEIDKASVVAKSNDGKQAVVFEAKNAIYIYNEADKLIAVIDRLKLALNNNIMKISFSQNSRYLLLWCNHFIKVFDIKKAKTALSVNLLKRPALDMWIDSSSEALHVILCNQEEYILYLNSGKPKGKQMPKQLVDIIDLDNNFQFWGPYNILPTEEKKDVFALLDDVRFAYDFVDNTTSLTPHRWFKGINAYYASENWLLYRDGEFYLNGDTNSPFAHNYADFIKSHIIEQLHDASPLHSFLREKNDLFSTLYEFGDRHLVLVSRQLNSIIAFDIKTLTVVSAFKINGNIIGCFTPTETSIELIVDKKPYKLLFNINLYDN